MRHCGYGPGRPCGRRPHSTELSAGRPHSVGCTQHLCTPTRITPYAERLVSRQSCVRAREGLTSISIIEVEVDWRRLGGRGGGGGRRFRGGECTGSQQDAHDSQQPAQHRCRRRRKMRARQRTMQRKTARKMSSRWIQQMPCVLQSFSTTWSRSSSKISSKSKPGGDVGGSAGGGGGRLGGS